MAKLHTVASAAAAGTQWHELLPALSPAERGRLLENLWRITPDQRTAHAIVVVLDHDCVWLDPLDPAHLLRRVKLPDHVGGLRSVAFDVARHWLLVGAARGVWTLSADDGEIVASYEAPAGEPPRTGFNSATVLSDRLFATHSQLGCWSWALAGSHHPTPVLLPENGRPRTIRAATTLSGERLALAADDAVRLFRLSGEEIEFPAGRLTSTVMCLTALDDALFAGTEDGGLYSFDAAGADLWTRLHRARGAFESVHARRWNDLVELVIPGGAEGVLGVFAGEGFVARLLESASPIRRSWACDDLIVGLSDRRDRLAVLSAHSPLRTAREAPIARLTGCTVQDACIVLKRGEPEHAGATPT